MVLIRILLIFLKQINLKILIQLIGKRQQKFGITIFNTTIKFSLPKSRFNRIKVYEEPC